jgi:hypothetical protein
MLPQARYRFSSLCRSWFLEVVRRGSVSVGMFVWGFDFWARRRDRVDFVAREERMVDIWRDLWDLRADTRGC